MYEEKKSKCNPIGSGYDRLWAGSTCECRENGRGQAKDLMLGTMKRAYERLLVKPSWSGTPQCIGDVSTME